MVLLLLYFWYHGLQVMLMGARPNAHISAPSKGSRPASWMSLSQSSVLRCPQDCQKGEYLLSQTLETDGISAFEGDNYSKCISGQGRQIVKSLISLELCFTSCQPWEQAHPGLSGSLSALACTPMNHAPGHKDSGLNLPAQLLLTYPVSVHSAAGQGNLRTLSIP